MLKKTIFTIFGMAINGFCLAGSMASTSEPCVFDATVPCAINKWDIGVQALYLKPTTSAHRSYEFTPFATLKEIEDEWDLGYRLEGSYHFNTGNDLSLTLIHLDTNFKNATGFASLTPFTGAIFIPFAISQDNWFDQVNFVLGQHVDFGLLKHARFYEGLQYVRIEVDRTYRFLLPLPGPTTIVQNRDTDFNGVGPVVGVDYAYNLPYGFHLRANSELSLLYGAGRYNLNFVLAPSGVVAASIYASKKFIIPSFEAKLGLHYGHACLHGIFNIEGGYQILHYFNVLQTTDVTCGGCLAAADYGLFGPYLGVKWVGFL